jgi:hypothetical protein
LNSLPFLSNPLVPHPKNKKLTLAKSRKLTLCTLVLIESVDPARGNEKITIGSLSSDYTVTPVARSYDKNDWENSPGRLLNKLKIKRCKSTRCITRLRGSGKYYLITTKHKLASFDEKISRFFMQTTFGPTRGMIDNWEYGTKLQGLANWMKNQASLPPTKHREYLRKHAEVMTVNNAIADTAASVQHPCEPSSRWRKYAFVSSDNYKPFTVVAYGNQFMILVDGKPRTIVDSFSSESGSMSGAGSYKFCTYPPFCIFASISTVFVSNHIF